MFKIVMASLGIWGLIIGAAAGYYFGSRGHYPLTATGAIDTTEPPNDISKIFYYTDLHFLDGQPDNTDKVNTLIEKKRQAMTDHEFRLFALQVFNAYSQYFTSSNFIYCIGNGETMIGPFMDTAYKLNQPVADIGFDPETETSLYPSARISEHTQYYLNSLADYRMSKLANQEDLSPKRLCEIFNHFTVEQLQGFSFKEVFPSLYKAALELGSETGD